MAITKDDWFMKETEKGFSVFIRLQGGQKKYEPPQWSHLMKQILQCGKVWDDQYRMAAKIFTLQKELSWDHVKLDTLSRVWEHHGLKREDNSMILSPTTLRAVIEDVLFATSKDPFGNANIDIEVSAELTVCLLWQLFDRERESKMTLLQAKVVLSILCKARPQDIWQLLAYEAANHDGQVSERRLRTVLDILFLLPCTLGEEPSLSGHKNYLIDMLIKNCFSKDWIKIKDQASIENWFSQTNTPVWLRYLARMRASNQVVFQGPCTVCKRRIIHGQVFRCEWCIWYWLCQRCYLSGRFTLKHRLEHRVTDHITPLCIGLEKVAALKRICKVTLCLGQSPAKHHFPTEPILAMVPPVKIDSPTSEPLHNLRIKVNDVIMELEIETRKLQIAASKWNSIDDAGINLTEHSKKINSLGLKLTKLLYTAKATTQRPESTPLHPLKNNLIPKSAFIPRLLDLSPIVANKNTDFIKTLVTTTKSIGQEQDSLELSTMLHEHTSLQSNITENNQTCVKLPIPNNVVFALDKLQTLLNNTNLVEESFSCRDNEQLERAVREFEELLVGVVNGIENIRNQPNV